MKTTVCRLCGQRARAVFEQLILRRHIVTYFSCPECGFTQTEEPFWLDEAYDSAPSSLDTGLVARNVRSSKIVATFLLLMRRTKGPCLDFAGGYGIFTRLMRDIGFDFYHQDPFAPNLLAREFEWNDGLGNPLVCTAFELLEHLAFPVEDLTEVAHLNPNYIITSTELWPGIPPSDWWYLAPESGQHIGFYQERTIRRLGEEIGYAFVEVNSHFQIFSKEPLSAGRWAMSLRLAPLLLPFLQRRLDPRTDSDHEYVRSRLQGQDGPPESE